MLFGNARGAFLEFLRNLTPQILLFSIAIILGTKLDLKHFSFDLQDVKNTVPFVLVLATFLAAAMANVTLFIENACTSVVWIDDEAKILRARGVKERRVPFLLLGLVWKRNKIFFFEITVAFLVAQVGLAIVLFSAIPAAVNVLTMLSAKG